MRFVISGEWTKNSLLSLIIYFFLFYIALFWITNALLFFNKMGLSVSLIMDYYRGSEERYLQPRSYQGLLEVSHFHLFAMGTLILTLTHLLLFAPISVRLKANLILISFGSAFLDEASSWLVRFVHPYFAYLKLISFLTLQVSLLAVILIVLRALWKKQPSNYSTFARD